MAAPESRVGDRMDAGERGTLGELEWGGYAGEGAEVGPPLFWGDGCVMGRRVCLFSKRGLVGRVVGSGH